MKKEDEKRKYAVIRSSFLASFDRAERICNLSSQPEKVQMDFLLQCCVLKEALQKEDYTYIAYKTI